MSQFVVSFCIVNRCNIKQKVALSEKKAKRHWGEIFRVIGNGNAKKKEMFLEHVKVVLCH